MFQRVEGARWVEVEDRHREGVAKKQTQNPAEPHGAGRAFIIFGFLGIGTYFYIK